MAKAHYFYARGGQTYGPVTSAQLRQLALSGQLDFDDLVWRDDRPRRVPAGEIPGLFGSAPPARTIHLRCPHCGQTFVASEATAGQGWDCPFCGNSFTLPAAVPRRQPAAAPPAAAQLAPRAPKEIIHRYGLAHRARETFQHAFGGSFGIAMGWQLGKFAAGVVIFAFLTGGCLLLGTIASYSTGDSPAAPTKSRPLEPAREAPRSPFAAQVAQGELRADVVISGLTWEQFVADCGVEAQHENAARAEHLFATKYRQQVVQWSGAVTSVDRESATPSHPEPRFQIGVKMSPSEAAGSGHDLLLHLPARCQDDEVLELRKGDAIQFVAILREQGGSFSWHQVDFLSMQPLLPPEASQSVSVVERIEVDGQSYEQLDLSWEEYARQCGALAQAVDRAQASRRFETKLQGRAVRWQGRIAKGTELKSEIVLGHMIYLVGVEMKPTEGRGSLPDLYLEVADDDESVAQLAAGTPIEFTAMLKDLSTEEEPHRLKLLIRH